MSDLQKTAPETKAVPETMTAAFDDFMEAFEAFKETNDRRLGEIEQKLTADVVRRFAQLGELMRIYTEPASFEQALRSQSL